MRPEEEVRIHLVDDDPQDREKIRQVLEPAFPALDLLEVGDRVTFEEALVESWFDMAVVESQLLWADGLTIFRALRARHPRLPVIMVTGSGDEEICSRAMRAGLYDYVVKKPSGWARLPRAARSALRRALVRRRREVIRSLEKKAFEDAINERRDLQLLLQRLRPTRLRA